MKSYRRQLEMEPWEESLRDYWDSALYQQQKADGLFLDEHDIGLGLTTDGLSLFQVGNHSVWPIVALNYNLPPEIRFKKANILLCGIIPGPSSPKDIHSFLRPLVDELKSLEEGIESVYDASTKSLFTLHAYICTISGDLPAITKMMGVSGHNSYDHCRFCSVEGYWHENHVYCPLNSPRDAPAGPKLRYDPANLPLRTDDEYREAASNLSCQYNQRRDAAEGHPLCGLRHRSPFFELNSVNFPLSFPVDIMHLIFENVIRTLYKLWHGEFFKHDSETPDIRISDAVWSRIGHDMESSRKLIPTSFGRAPRDINKYNRSFKAEEWCSFLLSYSPVLLRGALSPQLYEHYIKLVTAIEISIDYDISYDDIQQVKTLLKEFVHDYECLYYGYQQSRVAACLPTIHLLLHIGECLENCGPAWSYWQFTCERVCGMLKPKVKNRAAADRNLSLGILEEEQLNHLPFTSDFQEPKLLKPRPLFARTINAKSYGFYRPSQETVLNDEEAQDLAQFYHIRLNHQRNSRRRQLGHPQPLIWLEICKYGRCKLGGDKDFVSSEWCQSRRDQDNIRQASAIQYRGRCYGEVLFFFTYKLAGSAVYEMFAYVQSFQTEDISAGIRQVRSEKVIEKKEEGPREVICVSQIVAGIGLLKCNGQTYLIARRIFMNGNSSEEEEAPS